MKTRITLVAVLFFIALSTSSFAQYAVSVATYNSLAEGQTITYTNPCNGSSHSGFAGVLNCTVDGQSTKMYCVDLCVSISPGDTIRDSMFASPKVIWLVNNTFPYLTSYPGKISQNDREACAVQLAIWHLRHNLSIASISGSNGTQIRNRVQQLVDSANALGGSTQGVKTLQILPSMDPDAFYVKTLNASGNPIAVNNIQLTISQGSVAPTTVNTNASGISPDVIVSGTASGLITAKCTTVIPGGMVYAASTHNKQALIVAKPVNGVVEAQSEWGALPVELSSFVADIAGRDVKLNWSTVSESNNQGFKIERSVTGSNQWNTIGYVEGNGTTANAQNYNYTDRGVTTGNYSYRLKQVDYNGNFEYHTLNSEVVIGTPDRFDLGQNYPNPFNPSTKINYDLSFSGNVSLIVFDMSGKQIMSLVNETQNAGYYTVTMNAGSLSSGIYYYRLTASGEGKNFTATKKMILVK